MSVSSKLTIEGGAVLKGEVHVSGAKNSALPILAATILMDGNTTLTNVPRLMDVVMMTRMLTSLDISTDFYTGNTVSISNTRKVRHIAPYDLVTAMRASFFVAGPILAKTGFAKVPLPGGCSIGSRPIDLHLKGFKALGADVSIEHGFVQLSAKRLTGTRIYLDFPSVGATENIMMAATLADGKTVIDNAAQEPEIEDLGLFLNKAGAKIEGLGSSTITIEGVPSLKGCSHRIIPDRIEAGTLLIAGGITKGDVTIRDAQLPHLDPLLHKLRASGLKVDVISDEVIRTYYDGELNGVDVDTLPYPGFPTDMQAQMMSLLTIAKGSSVVKETIFENRFMHAHELMRMGASIRLDGHHALITGVESLSGADVRITDLRAGAALILAGLSAEGYTTVYGLHHLERGYDKLPEKLLSLGAQISF